MESRRSRGRDEYPGSALVAGMVFGHESSASLLRELGRNPALLSLCGFDPLVCEEARPWRDGVPTPWAFSRFPSSVADLEDRTGAVSAMVDALRGRLLAELPGYGRHPAERPIRRRRSRAIGSCGQEQWHERSN